jgi:hypothetical protein
MIQLKVSLPNSTLIPSQPVILTNTQTLLNCIDNSGAAIVECIKVLKMKRAAKIGKWSHFILLPSSYLALIYPSAERKLTNSQETA